MDSDVMGELAEGVLTGLGDVASSVSEGFGMLAGAVEDSAPRHLSSDIEELAGSIEVLAAVVMMQSQGFTEEGAAALVKRLRERLR